MSFDQANTELVGLGKQLTAEFPRRNTLRPKVVALDARINGAFRRLALGAGRGRLIRQAFTESILIAGSGGVLGFAMAVVATRVVSRLTAFKLPLLTRVSVDGWAVAIAIGLTLVVGISVGVLHALRAPSDANETLKEGQRGASGARRHTRARGSLVIGSLVWRWRDGSGELWRGAGDSRRSCAPCGLRSSAPSIAGRSERRVEGGMIHCESS